MILRIQQVSHWLWAHNVPVLPKLIYAAIRIIFSAVLPPSAKLGRDVVLGYAGLGVVIHARAVVGDRVAIGSKVTIGGRSGLREVPRIGNDVVIGTGAQILGPVCIGDGARIGANAVVLIDVPPGATAVGVPARVVASRRAP